jgi:regulator of sirC expression with transglutaminase-like and TPR domain
MQPWQARARFEALIAEQEIDLLRAAICIAAEDDAACDVESCVAEIDALARRALLPPLATDTARLVRLNELLFHELDFDGARCDFRDPASSFLPAVLERRTGLPIALSVLWMSVGQRLGLVCSGLNFPGHFLAKATIAGRDVFVDPFARGALLTETDLHERLLRNGGSGRLDARLLEAAPARQILARMLRNLKNLHVRSGVALQAYSAVDRLLLLTPDALDEVRDRGLLALQLSGHDAARQDLMRYLTLRPNAPDAPFVREQLAKMRTKPPLMN